MTQEVDAQTNEWITNAAPAEDTYATAPSETEYVAPDSTDPSTLITAFTRANRPAGEEFH